MEMATSTYRGMRQLGRRVEYLHLERLRVEKRRLRQVSRARGLSAVTAIQTEVMETVVTETARLVAMVLTRRESRRCGWLERVSICAGVEGNEPSTHQCRPGHPPNAQSIRTDPLNVEGDAEESNSNLQKLAKHSKSRKRLT